MKMKSVAAISVALTTAVQKLTICQTEKVLDPEIEGFSYNAPYFGQIQGWQLPPVLRCRGYRVPAFSLGPPAKAQNRYVVATNELKKWAVVESSSKCTTESKG